MGIDYQEWRPTAALGGVVLAYWSVAGDGVSVPSPAILPDAYVEIVINFGDPVALVGPPFTGTQPARAVVGLLETAIEMRYGPRVGAMGIRLQAGRAAGFIGVPAADLWNRVSPLASVSPTLDRRLAQLLADHPRLESPAGRAALDSALVEHLSAAQPADALVSRAVDRLLDADAPIPVAGLAAEIGVSARHLHRRFIEQVGTSPKHVERLARFARTWRQATMGPPVGWADLAAANGYADQSHLVREFRAFGAQPPAHLFTPAWYETTTVAHAEVNRPKDL
jgi:AraC-like DNA-binding protein